MDLKIKINAKERMAYIPKSLYAILGSEVIVTPSRAAVLMFNDGMSIDNVLKSIEIIKADLEHAKLLQEVMLPA